GTYTAQFLVNDTFTVLATSANITVQLPPPTITVTPTSVAPGAMVTVTVTNGPGGATDWVAVCPVGAPDTGYISGLYLNGSKTAPATGVTNATFQFTMPTTPGLYNLRFFPNNSTTLLAASATITVEGIIPPPPSPSVSVTPTTVATG